MLIRKWIKKLFTKKEKEKPKHLSSKYKYSEKISKSKLTYQSAPDEPYLEEKFE